MDPVTLALIFGGLGALKSQAIDKPALNRQRDLAAETQRNSPWTGLTAKPVPEADTFGTAMQFGLTGAQMGENASLYNLDRKLKAQQLANERLKSLGAAPASSSGNYLDSDFGSAIDRAFNPKPRSPWG